MRQISQVLIFNLLFIEDCLSLPSSNHSYPRSLEGELEQVDLQDVELTDKRSVSRTLDLQ